MDTVAVKLEIPKPLQSEHDELHATLKRATREGGAVGAAAQVVAQLLHPHFVKEEQFALPPIALLTRLARGEVTADMKEALSLTDRLERDLNGMLDDHKKIVAALEQLRVAARAANRPEYSDFAEQLIRHAQTEEQVIYPAAILPVVTSGSGAAWANADTWMGAC